LAFFYTQTGKELQHGALLEEPRHGFSMVSKDYTGLSSPLRELVTYHLRTVKEITP
jgi:hypothetical protein